jgi:hypothetical protein
MPGFSRARQAQVGHLLQLLLPKHLSVLKMAAVSAINVDLQQVEHIQTLKLSELKDYL